MKFAQIGSIICMVFTAFNCFGQEGASSYTFAQKYFQQEIHIGLMNEIGRLPKFRTTVENEDDILVEKDDYSDYFTFFRLMYEGKVIVKQFEDRASISVSVPAGISFSVADRVGEEMLLTSRVGLFVDGNIGNLSTYNNIKRRGASFGVGLSGVIPLVDGGDINNVVLLMAPQFRIGYVKTFNFRMSAHTSFYLYFSPGRKQDFEQLDGRVDQHRVGNSVGFIVRKQIGGK